MNLLILDTSQKIGLVALYRKGFNLIKKEFDARDQQKFLIDSVDALLNESEILLTDLTGISICIGPGSFTGTRIGVMTGKTFAYANNIPLMIFNSLMPYHTPGTLTLLEQKNNECFCYDGQVLKKIPYSMLETEARPIFAINPETIPFRTKQAIHSVENIISLLPVTEFQLIY